MPASPGWFIDVVLHGSDVPCALPFCQPSPERDAAHSRGKLRSFQSCLLSVCVSGKTEISLGRVGTIELFYAEAQ